jgi:hypothetical protein
LLNDARQAHVNAAAVPNGRASGTAPRSVNRGAMFSRPNVKLTGAHDQVRPKGADARGRPC